MDKARGTDGSLLDSLPWSLLSLSFALAPHVLFLPWWITVAFFACGAWRYSIEIRRRPIPPTWFRALLAVACFLGVLGTYSTISGVGPGSALLAVMAAMKLLETRKRRDQFVLLFISIFLVMSTLLREQYLWSLPYLVISVLLIMTAWLRVCSSPGEKSGRSLVNGSRLVMYAVPLAVAMWIFFPRIATPFWSVPIDTGTSQSGISDNMSPGDISSLSLSDSVAFRVTFADEVPAPRDLYWRGPVLTNFNGRTWTSSDPYAVRSHEKVIYRANPIEYSIALEPTRQIWVFALDMPESWTLRRTFMGPQQQLARSVPIDQRTAYDAVSYLDYRTDVDLSGRAMDFYTRVPESSNQRTQALAREMRDRQGSELEFIDAVLKMFHEEEYYYTLEPPLLGSNSVDRFLFDTRQGFCEHYASAFAVLMRSAGIPARVVVGYQGGEINPMGGHMIVRQSDAHAWNEVWLDGIGWRRVDPTAAVAPERIEVGRSGSMFDGVAESWGFATPSLWVYQVQMYWDSLDAKWNEWILGYGPDNQDRFMEWLGMSQPDWQKKALVTLALVVGIVLLISFVMALRNRAPGPDRATILYRKFTRKIGVKPEIGETPLAYASRVRIHGEFPLAAVDAITRSFLDARYGPPDPDNLVKLQNAVSRLKPLRS
jgi:transglutaminase-like putative cysteine protease